MYSQARGINKVWGKRCGLLNCARYKKENYNGYNDDFVVIKD